MSVSGVPSIPAVRQEINAAKRTEEQQQAAATKQRELDAHQRSDTGDSKRTQTAQPSNSQPTGTKPDSGDRKRVDIQA